MMMVKMKMVLLLLVLSFSVIGYTQQAKPAPAFHGAEAKLKNYKALYVVNQLDDKKIRSVLRNINNALEDPRLKNKLQVELVAFGDGVEMYKKSNHYDSLLTGLQSKGVLLV